MHLQGKGQGAVRIRLQGLGGDPSHQAQKPALAKAAAASLCCTPRPCTATPLMATPWDRSSPSWKRGPGLRRVASTSTKAIAATTTHRSSVWISGQVRRVTAPIRREMRRRAAVEPVIGNIKAEHRMGRNYLKGSVSWMRVSQCS
jgi:hypothetical protein